MSRISVIGSGSWGSALAMLLADNSHDVRLWSYSKEEYESLQLYRENKRFLPGVVFSDKVSFTNDLEEAADGAEMLVMVTPSKAMKQTAKSLAPFVKDGMLIINASKGLEQDTLIRLSEVIKEQIPQSKVAAISGPSHAEEVSRRMATTNVVASEERELSNYIAEVFMNDNFRVYTSDDIVGVELGGALKNVIAICVGMADGLELGDNAKAALMTRGMHEIARLGVEMGGHIATFSGLSGMGDLIVTCTSVHSRNRRAGILIGRGMSVDQAMDKVNMVVEGVYTTKATHRLAKKYGVEMPITEQAYGVLFHGRSAAESVRELMMRDRKHEPLFDQFLK